MGADHPLAGTAPEPHGGELVVWITAGAAACYLSLAQPLTWRATIGSAAAGSVIIARGLRTPRFRRHAVPPPLSRLAIVAWWAPLLVFSATEIVEDALGSTYQNPTLSVLMDPVTNTATGRFVGALAWIAFGEYLIRH
jgi:hypothetical protein